MREDAGYSERLMKSEADSPDANLKEFDDFCDRSVELRTERLIKILASLPERQEGLKKDITDHLNAENSLVRAKRRFYDLYSALRLLHARFDDVTRKARQSEMLRGKSEPTAGEIANPRDRDETRQRIEAALHFAQQSSDYYHEAVRLTGVVNDAAAKALDADTSYIGSLQKAVATEKVLAGDLGRLGVKVDTPIRALASGVASQSDAVLKAIQSQTIK